MDRSELQRLLSSEADGELDSSARQRLEQGLAEDPAAAEDRALFSLIGSAVREDSQGAPAGMPDRILERLRREQRAPAVLQAEPGARAGAGHSAPLLLLRRSALAAAAVLLLAGLVHVAQLPDQAYADDPAPTEHFVPGEELDRALDESVEDGTEPPKLLRWLLGRDVEAER